MVRSKPLTEVSRRASGVRRSLLKLRSQPCITTDLAGDRGEFKSMLGDVSARIAASSDLIALNMKWSSCMHVAGYEYSKPSDITDSLGSKLDQLAKTLGHQVKLGDPGLADLNALEFRLYKLDHDCETKLDYIAKEQNIRYAIEAQVIAAHPAVFAESASGTTATTTAATTG